MRRFFSEHTAIRGFLIIGLIALVVVVLSLEPVLATVGGLLKIHHWPWSHSTLLSGTTFSSMAARIVVACARRRAATSETTFAFLASSSS